ncbi:response regulator transcription factor [Acuticoccus sediminis]|uniref:response regulator transcription factor n=1 Tax=Acuticoccus sediminis TaxID=2184697 RepID=UPI001CFDB5F4|nr:response regulator [Acuticoccus sediminis]
MASAVPQHVIALVDDDPRILESVGDLLEAGGFTVLSFPSGNHLLRSDALSRMDCLITDIGLPGMDGFELQRFVKSRRPDVPVFLITGRHELLERHGGPVEGTVLRKPFNGKLLLEAIADAVSRKGARRE